MTGHTEILKERGILILYLIFLHFSPQYKEILPSHIFYSFYIFMGINLIYRLLQYVERFSNFFKTGNRTSVGRYL